MINHVNLIIVSNTSFHPDVYNLLLLYIVSLDFYSWLGSLYFHFNGSEMKIKIRSRLSHGRKNNKHM